MKRSPTRELANFVAKLRFEDIPYEVIKKTKDHILDTISVGLFGSTTQWGRMLAKLVRKSGEEGKAEVWGHNFKTSCTKAALANGTFVHGFELDDIHRDSVIHPGSISVPSAFAVSEEIGGIDGKDFITAVVAGYEVAIRVGMSVMPSGFIRGFHPTGICGTFGGAASASKILRLNGDEIAHAFGIAGSLSSGLMGAQYGAMVKRLHAGRAAEGGVLSALLAGQGFTGIDDVLELKWGGFCSAFSDNYDLRKITNGLGKEYELLRTGFKPYACAASVQTPIDALKGIMKTYMISQDFIEKIAVKTTRMTKMHCGFKYEPKGVVAAQMNIPYCLAVQLLEGDVFVDQFSDEKLKDPRIIDVTRKIEVIADPELDRLGHSYRHSAIVDIYLKDGRKYSSGRVDHRKGSVENPMTREELLMKSKKLLRKVLKEERIEEIVEILSHLEEVEDIRSIVELLKP